MELKIYNKFLMEMSEDLHAIMLNVGLSV